MIPKQSIGVASLSSGFQGVDGILGLGPVDLTQDTVSGVSSVPTVTDNLLSRGKISSEVVGISYAPTTSTSTTNGELTFGGVDSSKFTGSITFTSITSTNPANTFWGIDQSITYGSSGTTILSSTAGIVDTGTTLVLIATDAFNKYTSTTGATPDQATGLLTISSSKYANLQSLFFHIGGTSFEFTKNAQTWPRALNTFIGGTSNSIYLIVSDVSHLMFECELRVSDYVLTFYNSWDRPVGRAWTSSMDIPSLRDFILFTTPPTIVLVLPLPLTQRQLPTKT